MGSVPNYPLDEEGFRVAPLFDHHDHPALRQAYPELGAIRSRLRIDPRHPAEAVFDRRTNTLTIRARNVEEAEWVGIHELVHPIQRRERFARGGSAVEFWLEPGVSPVEAGRRYKRLAGEVEARTAQARLRMSAEERRARPFREMEEKDFPRHQQIIRY